MMFHAARRISRHGMAVRYRENGLITSRLGMMISKKAGNAVERNRIRRVLRDVFRQRTEYRSLPVDILVALYRTMQQLNNKELAAVFSELLDTIAKSLKTGNTSNQ